MNLHREVSPVIGPRRRSVVAQGRGNYAVSQRDARAMNIPAPIVRHAAVHEHDGSTLTLVYIGKIGAIYSCSVYYHRPKFLRRNCCRGCSDYSMGPKLIGVRILGARLKAARQARRSSDSLEYDLKSFESLREYF